MKQATPLLLLLAMSASTAWAQGASSSEALGPGDVAFVDGTRVPESVFRLFVLSQLQVPAENLTPEGRAQVIDRLVDIYVMAAEAEKRGLESERRVAAELELVRLQTLARYMASRVSEENAPTDVELRSLYDENLPNLTRTEYETRHILLATEDEAKDVIRQLDRGADFTELAHQHAETGPANPDDGYLGWITADSVVEPFGQAVQAIEPGTYSKTPVQTQFGWHVIRVNQRREGEPPSFEDIRSDLASALQQQRLGEFLDSLRQEQSIRLVE